MDEDHFTTANSFTKTDYRDVYPSIDPTSPALLQTGKVVVITSASRGIGKHGLALAFAKANAKAIVITARKAETLKDTEEEIHKINPGIKVLSLSVEVTDEESVKVAFEKVKSTFGTVDVLVNNAGHSSGNDLMTTNGSVERWWFDFEVNVKGQFLVAKHFLGVLGTQKKGSIVCLATGAALVVFPGSSAYSISKLAGVRLVGYTAAENPNVTVVAMHPGIVMTDMMSDAFAQFAKDTPSLAGGVALWLSTDAASFLNGRYISASWSVDELVARKEEIVSQDLLTLKLAGETVTGEIKR